MLDARGSDLGHISSFVIDLMERGAESTLVPDLMRVKALVLASEFTGLSNLSLHLLKVVMGLWWSLPTTSTQGKIVLCFSNPLDVQNSLLHLNRALQAARLTLQCWWEGVKKQLQLTL